MNSADRGANPDRSIHRAQAGALRVRDVFPAVRLLGRCLECRTLIFDRDTHEWATRHTHQLCWPYNHDAALYCGACSELWPDA